MTACPHCGAAARFIVARRCGECGSDVTAPTVDRLNGCPL